MNSPKSTFLAARALPALLALASLTPVYSATPRDTALADAPLAYYELGVPSVAGPVLNKISGASVGTSIGTVPSPGALSGESDTATKYNGVSSLTTVPFQAALNPATSFSFEAWVMPTAEGADTPQVIVGNSTGTTGWKITQNASVASTGTGSQGYTVSFYNGSAVPSIRLTGGNYSLGVFSHIVVTYNATTKLATLYVDGLSAATPISATFAANATAPLTLGGDANSANLFTGSVDEVAFYPLVLNSTQVSNHYSNALDSAPAVTYSSRVKDDGATYHLRLDETDPNRVVAVNSGTLGAAVNGLHFPGVTMQVPGALPGSTDTAIHYDALDKTGFNGAYSTVLPYVPGMNTTSFSAEAWLRPLSPSSGNNANVFRNHNDGSSSAVTTSRAGWVVWQNPTSPGGYSFRLYNRTPDPNGSHRAIDLNAGSYTQGVWQHFVVTFDSTSRTAKMYINGTQVGTQTIAASDLDYVPITPEEGVIYPPSFGGFSDGNQNPFIGDMDEVAYYDKALTSDQVSAHYNNGKATAPGTPYETLIGNDKPVAYYRENETPKEQVPNLVVSHPELVGTAVNAPASVDGPGAPADPGFPAGAKASDFNGSQSTYIELNNPTALNNGGATTLEAWIKPDAVQPFSAYIIGHGGNTGNVGGVGFREVFLRIEDGKYEVGDNSATPATFAVPAGDLGGSAWIHLAGVWSNGTWTLYRNGVSVATATDATGPQQIVDANWAIGARGRFAVAGYPTAPKGDQRVFNGSIATAGIYGSALTADRVNAHYQSGATLSTALSALTIVQQGTNVVLTWTSGTLAQSTDLVNWTDVAGATSPYTTTTSDKHFYRLHN